MDLGIAENEDDNFDESFFDGITAGLIIDEDVNIPREDILTAVKNEYRELARVGNFVSTQWRGNNRSHNSALWNQDRFTLPVTVFEQMETAYDAAKVDDIVSSAVDITEQLAFKNIDVDSGDEDSSDVGTQALKQLEIITRMREIWRDMFIVSQCYVAVQWGRKDFKVTTKLDATRPRKKTFKGLVVPTSISLIDPLKIIPVGNMMFGNEELAYIADVEEAALFDESLAETNSSDLIVKALYKGKYTPSERERQLLAALMPDDKEVVNRLYLLNPDNVFRITATKPAYQRFADVRMVSVFELLDLKHNLRESDRSDILGNLNCIVHVKIGSKDLPGEAHETAAARKSFTTYARNNLMVTDQRVEIDILTKKTDKTLQPERYNTLDSRITARLFQVLQTGAYSAGTAVDDSQKLFKVIASSMEARRELIRDKIVNEVIQKMWDRNDSLIGVPVLRFHPQRIALEFDRHYSSLLQQLNELGIVSNETILDELDLDIEQEVTRLRRERKEFSDVFDREQELTQRTAGAIRGGNRNGGGVNNKSFEPTPRNDPDNPVDSERRNADN